MNLHEWLRFLDDTFKAETPPDTSNTPGDVSDDTPDVDVIDEEETIHAWDNPWRVILFDDDIHTFEEVIAQLMKATGCPHEAATHAAMTVHNEGKETVYEGSFEECFRVNAILRQIQLITEIEG